MNKRAKPITIRVRQGEGAEIGQWVATIDEAPDFRVVTNSCSGVARAAREYADAILRLGPSPHPLLIQHHNDRSLENWLLCRKAGLEPALPQQGGPKWLGHSSEVLDRYGVSEADFVDLLDAQEATISRISLLLLESISHGKQLKKQGETHLARRGKVVPLEIIDWLIHVMLDGLSWYEIDKIPYDLQALIRFRLIPGESKVDAVRRLKESRFAAASVGGQMIASGKKPSYRTVAATLDVEPSTVKRWFKSLTDFQQQAERLSEFYHADGSSKLFTPPG